MKHEIRSKKLETEKYLVEGYLPTIGIECHVQLKTKTKLFSTSSNDSFEMIPNTVINQICFGLPGTLPVLNKEAVRLSAKAAYALGTKPQKFSKFDRKHYFYPDLPKGYQITQFEQPIILDGKLTIHLEDGSAKTINITRAHMEEDAGKSTHPEGSDYSLVDLNRAGTPLLEIVSEPEMHSSTEAKAYAKELWLTMKYAGVSDVDLYNGNMRFDVNVSVSKDHRVLGTRLETKNLNSFKSVERAVEYEVARQIELLEKGELVIQETRGWLDDKQKTISQRSKEDSHDYRYFPDPDIPPIVLDEAFVSEIEEQLPSMPNEWREALKKTDLDKQTVETLLEIQATFQSDFFNLLTSAGEHTKQFANWIINIEAPIMAQLGEQPTSEERKDIYYEVLALYSANKVNSNGVKVLIEELFGNLDIAFTAEELAEKKGLIQINNASELDSIVDKVIIDNPKPVEDVKGGETKAIGFLVGQVMKASAGKANPAEVQNILKSKLGV